MTNKFTGGKYSVGVATYGSHELTGKDIVIKWDELKFILSKQQKRILTQIKEVYSKLDETDQMQNSFFYQSLIKQIKTETE